MTLKIDPTNTEWLERNDLGLLGIKAGCFAERTDIEKVVISEGVGFVGEKAFFKCQNLVDIELPESMLIVGDRAFSHCPKLVRVLFPSDLTRFARRAFGFRSAVERVCFREGPAGMSLDFYEHLFLTHSIALLSADGSILYGVSVSNGVVIVPEGVRVVTYNAFFEDNDIKKVVLPNSVKEIRDGAFSGCTNLEEVEFGRGVEIIGRHAFNGCSSLKEVVIPSECLTISALAFGGCKELKRVKLPDDTSYCDGSVFCDCPNLEPRLILLDGGKELLEWPDAAGDVEIPNGISTIGEWAFCWCDKLTSVRLPDGVEYINTGAFCDCSSLTGVRIPSTVRKIEAKAFAGCSALKMVEIASSDTEIADDAFPPSIHIKQDEGCLKTTEGAVGRFAVDRCQENYVQAVRDFVFEVMATERRACFPVDVAQLTASLEKKDAPLATGIVRDRNGSPFLVFLTSQKMSIGTYAASAEMVASEIFVKAMQDPALAGVAVNPWNDGGIQIPRPMLMAAMAELQKMFGDGKED